MPGHGISAAGQSLIGPACPQNWYLLAHSHDLAPGQIISASFGKEDVVIFRGASSGRVGALAAHCRHMGCHLEHGAVRGDDLQCGLHHRLIDAAGRFLGRDGAPARQLSQPAFPVVEIFGGIFVYAGAQAAFDLPMPAVHAAGSVTTRSLAPVSVTVPWYALTSNGMDLEHFQAVHDRKLTGAPIIEQIDRFHMRLSYRSRVTGSGLGDRVMKRISGDDIRVSITCSGGSLMLVESEAGANRAFIYLSMCPTRDAGACVRGLVGIPGSPQRLKARIMVRVAAWLFQSFLHKDIGLLRDMRWHPPETEITFGDAWTRRLCDYFRGLSAFTPDEDANRTDAGAGQPRPESLKRPQAVVRPRTAGAHAVQS